MKRLLIVRIGGAGNVVRSGGSQVGTWVLNLEKSKYAPGTAPKSQRSVYPAAGKGFKVATTIVNAAGATVNTVGIWIKQ